VLAGYGAFDTEVLTEMIAEEDITAFHLTKARFRWRGYIAGPAEVTRARETFILGYGSCSFTEPLADLAKMGVI